MRKLHIAVVLISLLMMLSAAACGAQSGSTEGGGITSVSWTGSIYATATPSIVDYS